MDMKREYYKDIRLITSPTAGGKNITPQYIENKLKASIYINDTIVIGDNRKFVSCLIMIDEDNVIRTIRSSFPPIKILPSILPKRLYEEDGEVTPTMKIKRKIVNQRFKDIIEAMY